MSSEAATGKDLDAPAPARPPQSASGQRPSPGGDRSAGAPTLRRASSLTGLDVVTLGGDRAVEVKDVVFDKEAGALTGFTLRKPGLLGGPQKQVLPVEAIHAVGRDAVMIASHDVFVPAEALAASGDDVIGDRVITDDGTEIGVVKDVIVSVRGGQADIVGFELTPSASTAETTAKGPVFVPLPDALAISGEAVVVPGAVRDHLTTDLDELHARAVALRSSHGGAT